jgi:hypothetical protein
MTYAQFSFDHDLQQHIVSGFALVCHSCWGIHTSNWMSVLYLEEMTGEPYLAAQQTLT